MRIEKRSSYILILLIILISSIVLVSLRHPIILKVLVGSARNIGKPIKAKVYKDGQRDSTIEVYHIDRSWNGQHGDYYLIHFSYADTKVSTAIVSVNKKHNYVADPVSTNLRDYDIIFDRLFQSDVGSRVVIFNGEPKGLNFDPQLSFTGGTIKMRIPPSLPELKCDSIRIEL